MQFNNIYLNSRIDMRTIIITCDGCHEAHKVPRTQEIPARVTSMGCNWCPSCADTAEDYYNEWYNESESGTTPDPVPDLQLSLPFSLEEILDGHSVVSTPCKK